MSFHALLPRMPHAALPPALWQQIFGQSKSFSKPSWLLNDDDLRRALRLR